MTRACRGSLPSNEVMSKDRDKRQLPSASQPPAANEAGVSAGLSGQLIVPAEMLARAGIWPGHEVVIEATSNGLRIAPDSLRKVHIEVTSHCNLDCLMCVRHSWQEPLGSMPLARFERFVDGLATETGPRAAVAFSGFGEPLVHPEWQEMMRLARRRGHPVELITNGLLLDAAAARTLVDVGVGQITVSVDGGDDEAYMRMRGVPAAGALAAVHHLLEARRYTRQRIAVGIAALATRSTVTSLPALLDWATDLRLDFVSIGNVVPHTEEMAAETLWERASWVSAFHQTSWRPQLRVGRFDMEDATLPLAAALAERGLTYPSPSLDEARWRNRCRFAHEGMCAVSWEGRVSPCLSLLHSHAEFINNQARRVHEHVAGHVDDRRLTEIWRDPAFRAFRERVRTFDFPACFHCGGCPLTETNREDCYNNPAPVCGECLWAQNIVLCP